jgi:hypothetical protein
MLIKDFESIRVGSGWPCCVDVSAIESHESYGVFAEAFTYRCDKEKNFVQFRKHNKHPTVAMFSFCDDYQERKLPKFWKDSEVIWDSRRDK